MSRYYSKGQDIQFRMTSPEEEKSLFVKARNGDNAARDFLIHNHLLFAMTQAKLMVNGDLPDDDVTSAANYAVMLAFQTFEPARGVRFTTFLRPFIKGQISRLWKSKFSCGVLDPSAQGRSIAASSHYLSSKNDRERKESFDARGFGRASFNPVENVPDESPSVEELDLKKFNRTAVADALMKLPKRNADIVRRYYVDEWTLERIGKKHRLSRERIRQIIQSSLKKLRRSLVREGVEL